MPYAALRVPSKGALPPRFPHRPPVDIERERHSFYCLSKSPSKRTAIRVSQRGLYGDGFPFPGPCFTYLLDFPVKRSPDETKLRLSLKVSGKAASPGWSPNGATMEKGASFQSFPLHFFRALSKGALPAVLLAQCP